MTEMGVCDEPLCLQIAVSEHTIAGKLTGAPSFDSSMEMDEKQESKVAQEE
jgi:hypothetical protein